MLSRRVMGGELSELSPNFQIGCATDFSRWNVKVGDMEQIILAVASDPVAVMFPLAPEKIQEIALKLIA